MLTQIYVKLVIYPFQLMCLSCQRETFREQTLNRKQKAIQYNYAVLSEPWTLFLSSHLFHVTPLSCKTFPALFCEKMFVAWTPRNPKRPVRIPVQMSPSRSVFSSHEFYLLLLALSFTWGLQCFLLLLFSQHFSGPVVCPTPTLL